MGLNYVTFAAVLIAGFVVFSGVVVLFLHRRNNPTDSGLDDDDKYALSKIGEGSVYSYIVTDDSRGWLGAFATLGIQMFILVFFVIVSEVKLQDDTTDIEFSWKCPRDSEECRNTTDLTLFGWFAFGVIIIAYLAKDMINGSKLMYYSSKVRSWQSFRYFIGGVGLCSISLFALYVSRCNDSIYHLVLIAMQLIHNMFARLIALAQVSTVYNSVIATSDSAMIVNSLIVMFVMEVDEQIFTALNAIRTKHASDSDEVLKMKKELKQERGRIDSQQNEIDSQQREIDNQKTQVESQRRELGILRSQQKELMLQRDQVARQNSEIAILRGIVQQMKDSLEQSISQRLSAGSA